MKTLLKKGEKMIYTMKEVTKVFPRCTIFMVKNYRFKHGIGTNIGGRVFFTKDEVEQFVEDVESENIKMRRILFDFIKTHPGLKDSNLHNHLKAPFTKHRTSSLLADISSPKFYKDFKGLYEDDNSCLYVEGHEINLNKKYDRNNGIFY